MKRSLLFILSLVIVGLHLMAAVTVNVNGTNHTIPEVGETGWGTNVTNWIVDISADTFQKKGGTFTLTADANFGSTYGLEAGHFTSATANPASAGAFRLAGADAVSWRNAADSGDLDLTVNGSDQLTFDGTALQNLVTVSDSARIDLTLASDDITADLISDSITNTYINSAAAIAYSKLNLTGAILNADINASAAIDATKVHDGSVSNTEFGYLDGVTSAIQTQFGNLDSAKVDVITSTDDAVAVFNGTGGQLQDSGLIWTSGVSKLTISAGTNTALEIEDQGSVKFLEDAGNGTDAVFLRAPAALTTDLTFNLPASDGSNGQFLQTNGSGSLSFGTPSPAVAALSVVSKTNSDTPYSVSTSDDVILGDTSGGVITMNLPTAVGNDGKVFYFKYTDSGFANAITIDGNGSETIGGSTTTTLNTQDESIRIISDGSNWTILERVIPQIVNDYTPTLSGVTGTAAGTWVREGNKVHLKLLATFTGTSTGVVSLSLPSGLTGSAGDYPSDTINYFYGSAQYTASVTSLTVMFPYIDPTGATVRWFTPSGSLTTGDAVSGDYLNSEVWVHITGWNQ